MAVVACAPVDAAVATPTPQVIYLPGTPAPAVGLVMWNTPFALHAGRFTKLGLPDTFTTRIQFTATTPVRARIMSIDEFAAYLYTGSAKSLDLPETTALDYTFHDAEGCANYVLVLEAEADSVITPNLTITRTGPDHGLTGVCAN